MIKQERLIDADTGEICREKESIYINRLWSDKKAGGIVQPRSYHKKLYNGRKLSDAISDKGDLLKTYLLAEHIVSDTNRIGRKGRKGFARECDIADILNITPKKAREYLSRMQKQRIIAKMTAEAGDEALVSYVFNPVYVNSCKYVPLDLYVVFQAELDAVIPAWMRRKYIEAWDDRRR